MPPEARFEPPKDDDCAIAHPVSSEALERYTLGQPRHEAERIRSYVESQSPEEQVTHLEKVATEHLPGQRVDVWDVHTTGERYWVLTEPANLYAQRLFPGMDYTISFHIGLMARVVMDRKNGEDAGQAERLAVAARRWTQAAEAFDAADEPEEFQAVGMRCRETLLALSDAIARPQMVPAGEEAPKAADFVHWSALIANAIAPGSSAKRIRAHLKTTAESTWHLVGWLTHATTAVRADAELVVDATRATMEAFATVLRRSQAAPQSQCPGCGSYLVIPVRNDLSDTLPYAIICQSCDWQNVRVDAVDDAALDGGPDPSAY